jgi:hypothetical protein
VANEMLPAEEITSEQLQAQKAIARDKKRFVRVSWDGQSCICEPREVGDMTDGCDGAVLNDVWMTDAEFDALEEFTGW